MSDTLAYYIRSDQLGQFNFINSVMRERGRERESKMVQYKCMLLSWDLLYNALSCYVFFSPLQEERERERTGLS